MKNLILAANEAADSSGRSTPFVRQMGPKDCGLACLAMVAGHHGVAADLLMLRRLCMPSPEGVTLNALIGAATRIGLETRALRGEPRHFEQLTLPAILHWNTDHFVVLATVGRDLSGDRRFHIHDPARGSLTFGEAELSARFTGAMLELTTADSSFTPPSRRRRAAAIVPNSKSEGCPGASIPRSIPPAPRREEMTVQFTKSELRLLTEAEIDRISGGEGEEIVVTGYRNSRGDVTSFTTGSPGTVEPPPREADTTGLEPVTEPDLPPIAVRISLLNPANQARAEEAAKKLILALASALKKLNAGDPSAEFHFAGKSYIIGKVIGDINNTDYVVTDKTDFGNNGVGAATHGVNGSRHLNELNFEVVLNGYGRPYDDTGLMTLIFHELGHLSLPGYEFRNSNFVTFGQESADIRGEWNDSEYARNVERFANEFLVAVTSTAQITIGFIPSPGLGAEDPNTIFERREAERAGE